MAEEEKKIGGDGEPLGEEWQNLAAPDAEKTEDDLGYEEWLKKRSEGVAKGDFEGEKNETYAMKRGKVVLDEEGNPVMRKRAAFGNTFEYTPIQKGEHADIEYKARLEWMNLAAEKNEESPKSEIELEDFESSINREDYPEGEEGTQQYLTAVSAERAAAKEKIWREKVGLPSYEEYLSDFKKKHGIEEDTESAPESEEGAEDDPGKSLWSKLSKEERRDLIHRHRRHHGEKTEDWAKRIEAEEGMKIFSAEFGGAEEGGGDDTGEAAGDGDDDTPGDTTETGTAGDVTGTDESDTGVDAGDEGAPDKIDSEESSAEDDEERRKQLLSMLSTEDVIYFLDSYTEYDTDHLDSLSTEELEQAAQLYKDDLKRQEELAKALTGEKDGEEGSGESSAEDAEKETHQALLRSLADEAHGDWLQGKNINREALRNMSIDELRALRDEYDAENAHHEDGAEPAASGETDTPAAADVEISTETEPETAEEKAATKKDIIRGMFEMAGFRVVERKIAPKKEVMSAGEKNEKKPTTDPLLAKIEAGASTSEVIGDVDKSLDKAFKYEDIARAWKNIATVVEHSNDTVKAHVSFDKLTKDIESLQTSISGMRAELRKMPRFTFPNSEARYNKEFLQKRIADAEKQLKDRISAQQEAGKILPEITDETDRKDIAGILHLQARVDLLHKESNIRESDSRSKYYEAKGYHETSREDMRAASPVQRGIWEQNHRDYLSMRKQVDDYQAEHPDFVLEPNEDSVTPDVPFAEYTPPVIESAAAEIEDVEDGGTGEDLDAEVETRTPAEQALAEYEVARSAYESLNAAVDKKLDRMFSKRRREKYWSSVRDELTSLRRKRDDAEKSYVLEDGLEIIPEELRDEWTKMVDGADNPFSMRRLSQTHEALRTIRTGDSDATHAFMDGANERGYQFKALLADIKKFGGEDGKKVAEEYGYTEVVEDAERAAKDFYDARRAYTRFSEETAAKADATKDVDARNAILSEAMEQLETLKQRMEEAERIYSEKVGPAEESLEKAWKKRIESIVPDMMPEPEEAEAA